MNKKDLCKDKIEINVAFKIKVDPKTGLWYLKDVKMSHDGDFNEG